MISLLFIPNLLYLLLPLYSHYLYRPVKLVNTVNNVVLYSYFFSLIHSVFISFNSILFLNNRYDCLTYTYITLNSIVYLIIDIFILNYEKGFKKIRKIFTFHHMGFITLIYMNYTNFFQDDYLDTYIISLGLLGEICVIPLNINWVLIKTNSKKTLLFNYSNKILVIFYFLFRIIGYSYAVYLSIYYKFYVAILISLPLLIMNYVWFYKLLYLN